MLAENDETNSFDGFKNFAIENGCSTGMVSRIRVDGTSFIAAATREFFNGADMINSSSEVYDVAVHREF